MGNARRKASKGNPYPKITLDAATLDVLAMLAARDGCSMADVVRRLARGAAFAVYGVQTVRELMEIRARHGKAGG